MSFTAPSPHDLNAHLIGVGGGRAQLATPALIVERGALMANIAAMAKRCADAGIALRPHAKTHKCANLARLQIEAGAAGICCAKLGEAEALAAAGIGNILITSPIVTAQGMRRLSALNAAMDGLMVVVDSMSVIPALAEAARASGKSLGVLVDLDVGTHRTGIAPGEGAYELAAAITTHASLRFEGLQAYAGHVQHLADPAERRAKSDAAMALMAGVRDELTLRNMPPRILTGGGTGTFDIDPAGGVLNELQAGSYVYMDRDYNDVWDKTGMAPPFATSLFVQTTVISAALPKLCTTDAGFKSFATDAGPPKLASGAGPTASYFFFGDEQGGVRCDAPGDRPQIGDVLTCIVPHCDPTVNLYDVIHVVDGDTLTAIWPIEARGRGF